MKLRGVLFDKDGTLIDFDKTWQPIAEQLSLEIADGDAEEAARLMALIGFEPAVGRFAAGSIFAAGNNSELAEVWHPSLNSDQMVVKTLEYDAYFANASPSASVPLTDLPRVLGGLCEQGMILGIATNDVTRSAEAFVQAAELAHLFRFIIGYDGVRTAKPAGDMVTAFCTATNLAPGEVVVVGDNTHDLEMALAGQAGYRVGVLTGTGQHSDLEPLADVVLDSIDALPEHLAELNEHRAA